MTSIEARAIVSMLSLAFPGSRFGADNAAIFERAILDLDAAETQSAAESLIRSSPRMPTVFELRTEVGRLRVATNDQKPAALQPWRGSTELPTREEWGAVLRDMLERQARHRRLYVEERRRKGLAHREPDPCPFLELASRGAAGKLRDHEQVARILGIHSIGGERL